MNELTLLHVNQGSLTYKNDQTFYYGDTYILGQIVPLADSPDDLSSDELKPNEEILMNVSSTRGTTNRTARFCMVQTR